MPHPNSHFLLLFGFAFFLAMDVEARAQNQSIRPTLTDQNVVVLRNGGVLQGRAVDDGNVCIVYLGSKSEIRLPRDTIDFVCESMQQAYEIQRDRNAADDSDARLELAGWCISHDLIDLAETELAAIPDVAKSDIRVRSLRHQIASRRRLQQAHAEAPAKNVPESITESPQNLADNLLPQISTRSIGLFNTSVQSRLLNGCAASSCHGPKTASKFHLECESPGRPTTRRMTFANFAACFALIDQANPEQSKLLAYAATPHANLEGPVYRQGSKHFEAIANWVKTAALSESGGAAADLSEKNASGQIRQASAFEDLRAGSPQNISSSGDSFMSKELRAASFPNSDNSGLRKSSADPFDPEIFNNLYGSKPAAQTTDDHIASPHGSFGLEDAPQLQAPRRLSDSQKNGAIRISKAPTGQPGKANPPR